VVSRALRLIWDGALDENRVEDLAERVGVGSRHLRRLFVQHLGASPIQIAGTHRVHFARTLIDETDLPMTQVALSSGFMSIRQFNHSIKGATGQAPTELRRSRNRVELGAHQKGLTIRLQYRPPFDWVSLLAFLRERVTPYVENITDGCYQRAIEVNGAMGTISVQLDARECRLIASVELSDYRSLMMVVERVKRIFDLGADPLHIASGLSRDPLMKWVIESRSGLRMAGVWDGFELGVKAILGERLMASASRSLVRKLIQRFGQPIETSIEGLTHLFPKPSVLATSDLWEIGVHPQHAAAIREWAVLASERGFKFEAPTTLDDTIRRLLAIPNLSFRAANYIAMRAFGEPDAFPVDRSAIARFAKPSGNRGNSNENLPNPERWRPWRAYAAIHMWANRRGEER
jgi:AraC family transcriptional regulator of adaptative response / DNA-3-methyladenine glycosylase II